MTSIHRIWIGLAVVAVIAYALVNRYEIQQPPERVYTVRLDRWTGQVCFLWPASDDQPMKCAH